MEAGTLPEVLPTGTLVGPILSEIASALGLPKTVQVVMGSHDQIANAVGAGVAQVGDAVDTSGTCECITPLFASIPGGIDFQKDNLACVPYLEDCGYVTYAYNISAGSVVRWFRDALAYHMKRDGKSIYDVLNDLCPGEPTNLMVMPFLQGTGGTPDVDASAAGLIAGLTTQTRLPDIYRAILEGVTFEMRYNQERLEGHGIFFERLYACGGGAKSPAWLQLKADILECEILPVRSDETGALGSAILGVAAVTGETPIEVAGRFWRYGGIIQPDLVRQNAYRKRYEICKKFRAVYKTNGE